MVTETRTNYETVEKQYEVTLWNCCEERDDDQIETVAVNPEYERNRKVRMQFLIGLTPIMATTVSFAVVACRRPSALRLPASACRQRLEASVSLTLLSVAVKPRLASAPYCLVSRLVQLSSCKKGGPLVAQGERSVYILILVPLGLTETNCPLPDEPEVASHNSRLESQ